MANAFDRTTVFGANVLASRLGFEAAYTVIETAVTTTITVVFNEQIGAVDSKQRATVNFLRSEITPAEGDYFVLSGETERWYIVDPQDDRVGMFQVRADHKKLRL